MKILLIQASNFPNKSSYDRLLENLSVLWPPSTLEYLASLTPNEHSVVMIDDNYQKLPENEDFDLIGISYFTSSAPRAYKIADYYRSQSIPVVLGGYHATALPHEAKQHADSVVVGEAELIWPRIIRDFQNGKLKTFYKQLEPIDINEYVKPKRYKPFSLLPMGGIEATRGCPYRCEFCAISNSPIGCLYRKRDIDRVIEEIETLEYKTFVFYDSSLTVNADYTKELFRKMIPLNKSFVCFGNANVAEDEELLELAMDAGCTAWGIGFETVSQTTLNNELSKKPNKAKMYKNIVKKLHDYNMAVIGSFVFGFENDTPEVFDLTLEAMNGYEIDSIAANILTPLPGTPLYDRLKEQGRLLTDDWSKYDMYHVVFKPKNMTPDELFSGTKRVCREFYSSKNIIKRVLKSRKLGIFAFGGVLLHTISTRVVYKSIYNERYLDREKSYQHI